MARTTPRNVRIGYRRTSMRLEPPFWDALTEIAHRSQSSIGDICTAIAERSGPANLSSAVRVEVLSYFRNRLVSLERPRPRSEALEAPAAARGTSSSRR